MAEALLHVLPDSGQLRARLGGRRILRKLLEKISPSDGSEPVRPRGKADRNRLAAIIGHTEGGSVGWFPHDMYTVTTGRPSLLAEASGLLESGQAPEAAKALQAVKLMAIAIGENSPVADALDLLAAGRAAPGKFTVWDYATEAAKELRHAGPATNARENLRSAYALVESLATWTTRPDWRLSRHRQGLRPPVIPGDATEELDREKPETCGEFLWQLTDEPRRFPLARYISKKLHRGHFGAMIFDEIQELNNMRSAQGQAARRLMARGGVSLGLSGSIMSGYASSLFPNFVSLVPAFEHAFGWDGAGRFLDAYGFRKWVYTPGKKVGEWTRRDAGEATGVMPLFLLRYLLPSGVIVHQGDLDQEIPPAVERQVPLRPETAMDDELLAEYLRMEEVLLEQIEADMFTPGLSGKLFGALLELPSYLDRCTEDKGPFVLRYPPDCGGAIVAEGKLFPADYRTPKERRMVELVHAERENGRRVALFVRHVACGLPERLMRILREEGIRRDELVYLSATAVPAGRRKSWIRQNVVKAGASVMVCNPNTVRTGLNDLVYLSTAWWHEHDPGGALTFRQANGRLHRPGQTRETLFLVPYYTDTAQEIGVDLMARKVEASEQVDALSVLGSLRASGAEDGDGEDEGVGMSIGQVIYERLKALRNNSQD